MKTAKRKAALSVGAIAATLGIAGLANYNNTYAEDNWITFEDVNLATCISEETKTNPGGEQVTLPRNGNAVNIGAANQSGWFYTYCNNKGISSLSGIENLPEQFSGFSLDDNNITSIAPFANRYIFQLAVDNNQISSLAPLDGNSSIEYLSFNNNQITSLEPLSAASNLKALGANNNQITSLEPLSVASGLKSLAANNNKISSPAGLADKPLLETVDLSGNSELSDISPLYFSPNLKTLAISSTKVNAIGQYAAFNDLEILFAYDTKITDISKLSAFSNLKRLSLARTDVTDFSPIYGLQNLEYLQLWGTSFGDNDLSAIQSKGSLTYFNIGNTAVRNISAVSSMTNLESLYIYGLDLDDDDYQYFTGLTNIKNLSLAYNNFTTLRPLGALRNLEWLNVAENNISDFSGVPSNLTYDNSGTNGYQLVYGQELEMAAGEASEVELPAIFSQYISSIHDIDASRVKVTGGTYNSSTNSVTIDDDAEEVVVMIDGDLVAKYNRPYYVKLTISHTPKEEEKKDDKKEDKKESKTDNPKTSTGISAVAGIFGGMVAAAGAVLAIRRGRR